MMYSKMCEVRQSTLGQCGAPCFNLLKVRGDRSPAMGHYGKRSNGSIKIEDKMERSDFVKPNEICNGLDDEHLKEHLVREIANIWHKKSLHAFWQKLNKQTGYNTQQLWKLFQSTTVKKIMSLLVADDILNDVALEMRLSPSEWLLFDLILVHQKINVANCDKPLQCLNDLYELVLEYDVEKLMGDELADAWIRLTLKYNNGNRLCSPMLLQLRWYQLKELSRQQVYSSSLVQDCRKTKLLHAIAIKYQKIITQAYPTWNTLVEEERVILPEAFVKTLHRNEKWKGIEACELWYLKANKMNFLSLHNIDVFDKDVKLIFDTHVFGNPQSHEKVMIMLCRGETILKKTDQSSQSVVSSKNKTITLDCDDEMPSVKHIEDRRTRPERIKKKKTFKDFIFYDVKKLRSKTGRKFESNTGHMSGTNTGTKKQYKNYDDAKLLMKTSVYTKKLDVMNIFKHKDYNYVNSKKIIEHAMIESKPVFKSDLKSSNTQRLHEQISTNCYIPGESKYLYKIPTIVESTSWFLQKPRNCKYSSGQLCKNPDFNLRLKTLSPEFFSASKNVILLNKCKPLTIDVHKELEKNLIKGKLFVRGFKSDFSENCCKTRKKIKLPHRDQIRLLNQRLQTAKVRPIRNELTNNMNSANLTHGTVPLNSQ